MNNNSVFNAIIESVEENIKETEEMQKAKEKLYQFFDQAVNHDSALLKQFDELIGETMAARMTNTIHTAFILGVQFCNTRLEC